MKKKIAMLLCATLFCASALTGCSNLDNPVLLPIQSLQLKVPQNLKLLRILLTIPRQLLNLRLLIPRHLLKM